MVLKKELLNREIQHCGNRQYDYPMGKTVKKQIAFLSKTKFPAR